MKTFNQYLIHRTPWLSVLIIVLFALLKPGDSFAVAKTWDAGAGDGLWSSANNWNPNGVPADGDDVTIDGDYTVTFNVTDSCRTLTLIANNNNSRNVRLIITGAGVRLGVRFDVTMNDRNRNNNSCIIDVQNGAHLLVGDELLMVKDASAQNNNDMLLRINDNSSRVTIIADLDMNFASTAGNNDVGVVMEEDSRLDVGGDLIIDLDGSMTGNDVLSINSSGTAGDGAVVNVTDDIIITQGGSSTQDCIIDLDYEGRINCDDFVYTSSDGAGFSLYLDRDSYFNVTDDFTLDVNSGANGVHRIYLNQNNNGSGADAQFVVGDDFNVDKDDGDQFRIYLADGSDFIVGNDMSISTTATDDDADDFHIQLAGSSKMDVDSLSIEVTETRDIDVLIDISGTAELETTNNLRIYMSDATDCEINLTNSGVLDVGQSLNFENTSASQTFELDLDNTSIVTIGNDLTVYNNSSTTAVATSVISMDEDAAMTVNGDVSWYQTTEGIVDFNFNENANGSSADAQLHVLGDFLLQIDDTNCDGGTIELNENSDIDVDGTFHIEVKDMDADDFQITLNDQSKINTDVDFQIDYASVDVSDLTISLLNSASITVGRDFLTTSSSDNLSISLSNSSLISVARDWTVSFNNADDYSITMVNTSSVTVGDDFTFSNTSGANRFYIDMDNTSVFSVTDNMSITNYHAETATNSGLFLDRDAALTVGGDLSIDHRTDGNLYISLNQSDNGSAADAQLNVVGDFTLSKTSGDAYSILMSNDADINVNGNFYFNSTDQEAGDDIAITLNNTAKINVDKNFTFNCTQNQTDVDLAITLNTTNNQINVGLDDIAGPYTNYALGVTWAGTGNNFTITQNNTSYVNVYGSYNIIKSGGANYTHTLNNSAELNVYRNCDFDNTENANNITITCNNSSLMDVDGNIDLTGADAASRVILNYNSTSKLELAGNILRDASPNRFGDINFATGATCEYNGSAAAQTIAGDAGNTDGITYGNVIINNTYSTAPELTMTAAEGNATIPNGSTLTFSTGVVSSSSSAYFIINVGGAATSGNATSFNDGPIRKIGTTAFTFPVGDVTGSTKLWARLYMNPSSGYDASTAFSCQYYDLSAPSPTNLATGVDHVSYVEYWDLTRAVDPGSNAACNITLYWEDAARSVITDNSDLRVVHYNSATSKWENHGGTGSGGSTGSITTTTAISSFSPISFGSGGGANPLPIELLEFTVKLNTNAVDVSWSTATETNNDYFIIEKSKDGIHFEPITKVKGAGTSTGYRQYRIMDDSPYAGISYYRLKQVDFDGSMSYSQIASVEYSNKRFNVYPNPVKSGQKLYIDGDNKSMTTVLVYDLLGNSYVYKNLPLIDGLLVIENLDLSSGTYFLFTESTNNWFKFIVQ